MDYTIKTKTGSITFINKSDYDNYLDFTVNGLKCIRYKKGFYFFNNGDKLTYNASVKILKTKNGIYTNKKYFKKYLDVLKLNNVEVFGYEKIN